MAKKKIFLDTEFTGLHKLSTLISIGLVAEDGREFYAEFTDYDEMQLNDWLQQNVINNLVLNDYDFVRDYKPEEKIVLVKGDTELIAQALMSWFSHYKEDGVEIWGDCLAWDWVLFASIFGSAHDMPNHIFYLPMDLSTALRLCRQDPDVNRELFVYESEDKVPTSDIGTHNALYDARIQMEVYKKILNLLNGAGNDSLADEVADTVVEGTKDDFIEEATVLPEVTSDVKGVRVDSDGFIEPTQDMVDNGGEEFEPPI